MRSFSRKYEMHKNSSLSQTIRRNREKVSSSPPWYRRFCEEEVLDSSSVDLWGGFYKIRVKNSSIPTGKRGWFRIIAKLRNEILYPFLIYPKTEKENATIEEIEENYEKMIIQL